MRPIIIIGRNTLDDYITIEKISDYLISTKREELALRLVIGEGVEDYDISTKPEKGDAMDALSTNVELVVALHLYGIDHIPGKPPYGTENPYMYCRDNQNLLKRCMLLQIPLVVWGDQPWNGVEKKTQIHDNALWIYEPASIDAPSGI